VAHIVAPAAWLKLESYGHNQEYSNVPVYYDGWFDVLTTHWESFVSALVAASGTMVRSVTAILMLNQSQTADRDMPSECDRGYTVMQNTPRKNVFINKPRDESRFHQYLLMRVCWVGFSVYVVGYIAIACVYDGSTTHTNDTATVGLFGSLSALVSRMSKFHDNIWIDDGLNRFTMKNSLVADLMSIQLLLGILGQSMTMVHRGQTIFDFPHPGRCKGYYMISIGVMVIHGTILTLKHIVRGLLIPSNQVLVGYADIHYIVYILIIVLNIIGMLINSLYINSHDLVSYRRYQQFLRLEFDTRLGMHSPR